MKNIPQAYRPSYLWFWPPLIMGGFSNFCRYYTRSQAGKSTGYRPTLKPLWWPPISTKLTITLHVNSYLSHWTWINNTIDTYRSSSYLDLHIEIDNDDRLRMTFYDNRGDFNFSNVNFCFLYVASFQQHFHIEYIYIFLCISHSIAFMVHIVISLIEGAGNKVTTEPSLPSGQVEVITSKFLRSASWLR